ncbi:hypothetical protein RS030_91512 [Cryptosporidium xiaoi]|uniref:Uncharacterized protein n=1 Tax=Cryptosporidium xiaoi TaxID=659607 RepID=A0AAV9XSN6_9CRYT
MDFEIEFSDSSNEGEQKILTSVPNDNEETKIKNNSCSRSGRVRKMRYSDFSLIDENQGNSSDMDENEDYEYKSEKYNTNKSSRRKKKQDVDDDYENDEYGDNYEDKEYDYTRTFKGKNKNKNKNSNISGNRSKNKVEYSDDDYYDDYNEEEDYVKEKSSKVNGKKKQRSQIEFKKETRSRSVRSSRKTVDYSNFDCSASSDSISDDYDKYENNKSINKSQMKKSKITYDDDYNNDDDLLYPDEKYENSIDLNFNDLENNAKNIDRVLESRCNEEDNSIIEYKIKWMGYSHLHNTWETVESLTKENVGGIRRLENFQKKMAEIQQRRKFMTEDEIEQENITFEIQKQLDMDALIPEKIVDVFEEKVAVEENKENYETQIYYFVKWLSCPYDQCTWESYETLVEHNFLNHIESFNSQMDIICKYNKDYNYEMRSLSLTSFEPYPSTPFYMGRNIAEMNKIRKNDNIESFLDSNVSQISENPPFQNDKLREYQVYGLNWIISRFKKNVNVLLADEMGLGKTVQTISVVGHCIYMEKIVAPFLVMVPQSTSDNWMREFKRWLPDLNVVLYHGNAYARELIRNYELRLIDMKMDENLERVNSSNCRLKERKRYRFDVVITTPSILNSQVDCEYLKQIEWYMMIVDEAHQLKNRDSKRFKELNNLETKYRLLLSGTPLHNNLEELWSLLHFLNPNSFYNYNDFRMKYPDVENPNVISMDKQKQLEELQEELQKYVLRRVKKDVEKSLPKKIERILRVELSPQQTEIYKSILSRNYSELSRCTGGTKTSLQNICMELKKVCNHPFLIHRPELDPNNGVTLAKIQHQLKYSCGKLCLLDKLLFRLKEKGSRVLIFSQMVMMLNIISEFLVIKGYKHQRLDGTMGKELRKKAMDRFNSPNSDDFCFLLSTKAGGLGINLTTADTVIIYDSDWNPQNDLQAEARAHRIGQKKQVQIYRLVTKDSIEENILERAKTKMVLDTLVVQGLNNIERDGQRMNPSATSVVSMATQALYPNGKKGNSSGTCFSRDELAKILKFGAQKLWNKSNHASDLDNGNERYNENSNQKDSSCGDCDMKNSFEEDRRFDSQIDLDKVLADAEENTHDTQGLADGLLSSFANISDFRYEAPPLIVDSNTGVLISLSKNGNCKDDNNTVDFDSKEFWEKTIPEEERRKYSNKVKNEYIITGPRKSAMRDGTFKYKDGYNRKNTGDDYNYVNDCNDDDFGSKEDGMHENKKSKGKKQVKNINNKQKPIDSVFLAENDSDFGTNSIINGCSTNNNHQNENNMNIGNGNDNNMMMDSNEHGYKNANYPLARLKLDNRNDFENLMFNITSFKCDYDDLDEKFPDEINNIYKSISSGKKLLKNGKRAKRDIRLLNPKKRFKVFRSILKYGDPYRRLDDIIIDSRFKGNVNREVILNEAQIIISLCYEKYKDNSNRANCNDYYNYCDLYYNQCNEDYSIDNNSNKSKKSLILIGNNKANSSELVDRIKILSALDKLMKECNPGVVQPWKLSTGPLSRPNGSVDTKRDSIEDYLEYKEDGEDYNDDDEDDNEDDNEDEEEIENSQEERVKLMEKEKEDIKEEKNEDNAYIKVDDGDYGSEGETSITKLDQNNSEKMTNIKDEQNNKINTEIKGDKNESEFRDEKIKENNEKLGQNNSYECNAGGEENYLRCKLPPLLVKSLRTPSWGVPWTIETDINILKGIYVYGFSNWTLMSMDENLSLSCIRSVKFDKLKQRALRMLKHLHSLMAIGKTARKKRKASANNFNSNSTSPCSSKSPPEQDSVIIKDSSKCDKRRKKIKTSKDQESIMDNSSVTSSSGELNINEGDNISVTHGKKSILEFVSDCINMSEKELRKQARICLNNSNVKSQISEIKKLFQPGNDMSDSDIVANLKLYLPSVGDEINKILELAPSEATRKKLHSSLWSFVAKCTVFQSCDIEKIYLGWKGAK